MEGRKSKAGNKIFYSSFDISAIFANVCSDFIKIPAILF
jgi:hypothetical protein